jgi:uncharacterized protein YcgL (UPF0745 family)
VFIIRSSGVCNTLANGEDQAREATGTQRNYHSVVRSTAEPARGGHGMNQFLNKIVNWLRAGYPDGVPASDTIPVIALLERKLSHDEVKAVAQALMDRGEFDQVDIGVAIIQMINELPAPADIERVRQRLAEKGWPLDDPRQDEESG